MMPDSSPKRGLMPDDLYDFVLAGSPAIPPDGKTVLFTRTSYDRESGQPRSALWRVADGKVRAFTTGTKDGGARISPDGSRVAFLRRHDEKAAIFTMPLDGGEAQACASGFDKIASFAWSPDGTRIAFAATAPHEPASAPIYVDEKTKARHIRRLPFKSDDDGLLDGIRSHLFIVDAQGGEPTRLTTGDFDAADPAFSPDGARIAFSAAIDLPEAALALGDIYVVEISSRQCTKLTHGKGPAGLPAFSHDGGEIAFVGHERGDDGGGGLNLELLAVPAGGGDVRSLSRGWDRSIGDHLISDMKAGVGASPPVWSANDAEIFVLASIDGTTPVVAFARGGGTPRTVVGGEREILGFSIAHDGTLAFAYTTPVVPAEMALLGPDGRETQLTSLNAHWLDERVLHAPRRLRPPSADGTATLDAWLLVPENVPQPMPLVLEVHGGPHAAYGSAFFFEFQILASLGMAVVYGNPRGSQSYGEGYASAIAGDWGGIDVDDVFSILDAAHAAAPVDPARVGVAGGSYGGFMTTTLLGRSQRFAAGVSMRAVNDFTSEIGASDLGWFLEREVDARWIDDAGQKLFDLSPMRRAHEISTPLLIEHSERDFRCPIDQGEQLFTLLRRLGKTAEFVRFTNDGHNLSRSGSPRNRLLRLRAIAQWFVRYLAPAGSAAQPDEAGALFRPLPGEREE